MAKIEVYQIQAHGFAVKHIATINRVVWTTHPGFADGAEYTRLEVSGTWTKHTQHWCRFDGERRLLDKHKGTWSLTLAPTQTPKKQVLF